MIKKDLYLLIGNYNASNIGDDTLKLVAKDNILKYVSSSKLKIIAPKIPADSLLLPTGLSSFFKFKWLKTLYYYFKARLAIFGGGGLLNHEEYRSLLIWGLQIYILKLFRVKVYLMANSVTPSSSKLLMSILKKVDLISVRDDASFKFLNKLDLEIPIRKTADLALLFNYEELLLNEFEFDFKEFVVINLRSYRKIDLNKQAVIFERIVNTILDNSNLGIYLMPFEASDVKFLRKVSSKFIDNGRVITLPLEKLILITAIKKAKFVVSQRLHPTIFAMLMNKPFISLSYSSKVKSLLKDLIDDEYVIDLQNSSIDVDRVFNLTSSLLRGNESHFLNNKQFELMKKEAEVNFSLLKLFDLN